MGPLISSLVSSEMALLIHLQHAVPPAMWRERYICSGVRASGSRAESKRMGRWGTGPFRCTRLPLIFGTEIPQEELGATSMQVRAFGFVLWCVAGTKGKIHSWLLGLQEHLLCQAP